MPAPTAAQRVAWPAAFGIRFLVSVDVEEEFDWSAPLDPRNRATTAMAAFPAAHARFAAAGVPLLMMVDHPIASDDAAVDMLRRAVEDDASAIGAQLHPWVTPPEAPPSPGDSFPGNLPRAWEAAKLATLTGLIEARFGRRPIAYRAGRYGIGAETLSLLAALGYRVDSSVRAHYDYSAAGGPDFTAIGAAAYRDGTILELPLTSVFTGRLRGARGLYGRAGGVAHARGALARMGLIQRVALTPEDMPIADALEAVAVALGEGERLLHFAFHSPSLVPGHTPYVRDAADLRRFWAWWDAMFAALQRRGVTPATLEAVIAAAG